MLVNGSTATDGLSGSGSTADSSFVAVSPATGRKTSVGAAMLLSE